MDAKGPPCNVNVILSEQSGPAVKHDPFEAQAALLVKLPTIAFARPAYDPLHEVHQFPKLVLVLLPM